MTSETRHKVVIIGSGFGGIAGAKKLKDADVDVTLISKTTYHLFQPLLYQVATGIISEGVIAPINREILKNQKNARVVLGEVTHIDLTKKVVTSEVGGRVTEYDYDSLIVAAGADQSYFGHDEFATYAPGMKTIDEALEIRARIMGAFERAEAEIDPEIKRRLLTFVIVGAGPTGVELTGQIAEMAYRILRKTYDTIKPEEIQVILMDAAPSVLPPMGEKAGKVVAQNLEDIGVKILLNAFVSNVDEDSITYKDKDGNIHKIEAFCKIWSAGVSANPLGKIIAEQSGAATDRAGKVVVLPDLTVPNHPEVFVVGDLMSVPNVPGQVQGALQGARYAAKAIIASLHGQKPEQRKPFSYFDKGQMAYVTKYKAVVQAWKIEYFGWFAWVSWLGLHLYYLPGIKNKFFCLSSWIISFLSTKRSQLVSTEQQIYGRVALEELEELEEHEKSKDSH